jgi:prevent-host-death family protein
MGISMHVSVHAAKTNLSKLIEAVERGERVVITRHGAPAVELVPARRTQVRLDSLKGLVPPPPEGLFAPMDEDELRDWGAA